MNTRYERQIALPEIGPHGQEKLRRAKILCVGAGGLGCPALLYLAAAGVGTVGIVDDDRVEISNLQRQVLYAEPDKGFLKADIAKERLLALNPQIDVHAYAQKLTPENADNLIGGYDIVLDATDNFAARYAISDAAARAKKPVVYAAIQGFEGQVGIFCLRCLYPQPPKATIRNCADAGILGAVSGMIGSVQATEAIKLIVAHESFRPLSGLLWMIDARTMETRTLHVPENVQCPLCNPKKESSPMIPSSSVCQAYTAPDVTVEEANAMKDAVWFDVREEEEWNAGHVPGAKFLPLSALKDNPGLFIPEAGKPCIIYCQRGMRSRRAADILAQAGFTNLYNLTGGYFAWEQSA